MKDKVNIKNELKMNLKTNLNNTKKRRASKGADTHPVASSS
jgi:hypothetical protein